MRLKPALFKTTDLTYVLNKHTILDSVSMTILQGEYCALIGPNGGGKTTLIKMLLSLLKPTSGTIELFGVDIDRFTNFHLIGFVPQQAATLDRAFPATVKEVVQMGRAAISKGLFAFDDTDLRAVDDAMHRMMVFDLQDRLIGELSGGQRQRVLIARALAAEPKALILDEPNTGVDQPSQAAFYDLLRELNVQMGLTILFVTHDVSVIADDITKLFTINRYLTSCSDPKAKISCSDISTLYGTSTHLLNNHHRH